jgi:phage terminase large subunit
VIDYIEESGRTLDWYVGQIERRAWRWGDDFIPHDGRTRDFKTGKSTEELLAEMGRRPNVLPMTSVEEGIKAARVLWPRVVFDREKCGRLLECLKRYRRQIHATTGEPMGPLHDEFSHGADNFRYLGQAVDLMSNAPLTDDDERRPRRERNWRTA